MKTNYGILALLMSACIVQSTKMNHIETVKPLLMAQMESKAGSQFILNSDGTLKSQNVALDLDTLVSLWGADLKTNWMQSGDPTKSTLWNYLNRVDSEISNVNNVLGINLNNTTDGTVKQYFLQLNDDLSQQITNSTLNVIQSLSNAQTGLSSNSEGGFQITVDLLTETVNRLRFLTERIASIEQSLGSGYIGDAGAIYGGYNATEIPFSLTGSVPPIIAQPHKTITPPVINNQTSLAQLSNQEMKNSNLLQFDDDQEGPQPSYEDFSPSESVKSSVQEPVISIGASPNHQEGATSKQIQAICEVPPC